MRPIHAGTCTNRENPEMTKFKICCIQNREEAELAVRCGAHAIGLVSAMPSGPGVIAEAEITEIAAAVKSRVETFLLTSLRSAEAVIAQHARCQTSAIQLVDELTDGSPADIREALPGVRIVQVIHVTGKEALPAALKIQPGVDAILLDSGNPARDVKELGGTGRTHNWQISREIVRSVNVPVYLAGGLNPANVGQAVKTVQPYAVDVCSGVRTSGNLDSSKLNSFINTLSGHS